MPDNVNYEPGKRGKKNDILAGEETDCKVGSNAMTDNGCTVTDADCSKNCQRISSLLPYPKLNHG